MNPLCPNCQTELTDDFGLVDCKSCGAVCSIDLEDNVTVQGDEPVEAAPVEEPEALYEAAEEEVIETELEEEAASFESIEEEPVESTEEPLDDYLEPSESVDEVAAESEEHVSTYEAESLSEVVEDPTELLEDEAPAVSTPFAASLSGEDFLKDLEVFSEESTTDGGHIYYDFHVVGLDVAGLRENFIETLADSRLEISEDAVREILGDSTEFTLPQISFLRLTVIYKRLMPLGFDMSWSLSEVQEPVSYMVEESVESEDYYEEEGEDGGGVVYEEAEEEY